MKRIAGFVLAVLALQIGFAPPSHAIFGLSQCEKMWSAIDAEEKIGRQLWLNLNTYAKQVDKTKFPTQGMAGNVAKLYTPAVESVIKNFKLAQKNPECFTTSSNAFLRTELKGLETFRAASISAYREYMGNPSVQLHGPGKNFQAPPLTNFALQWPKFVPLRDSVQTR